MPNPCPTDLPTLRISDTSRQDKITQRLSKLVLDDDTIERFRGVFLDELRIGMEADPDKKSSLQMENTFIPKLLNGKEAGEYMALDLGGTNFRVILLKLQNGSVKEEIVEYYHVPEPKRLGPGEELFDFLATCIKDFITKKELTKKQLQLGFTFSFPMTQEALDIGILVSWTKSYNCPGVVGEDAVRMLNEALKRVGNYDITVTAILNDATGTLIQGSYYDPRCAIGMILGTGSNICYIEQVANLQKWVNKIPDREVIVDIEWGAFGDNGVLSFLRTEWDDAVDNKSLLTASFTFEKYFAGKYLGDLVRECLLSLCSEGLFCKEVSPQLAKHGSLTTSHVSTIETEFFSGSSAKTREIMATSLMLDYSDEDILIVQYVAGMMSYRGALLVSLLTACTLAQMKRPHCTIAIDGTLFELHPRFRPMMESFIAKYSPTTPFNLKLVRDGSGKGAALVAAIADRLRKEASLSFV